MSPTASELTQAKAPSLSDDDIIEGMKALHGYIDLTPHDFKQLYLSVYEQARQRILREESAASIMKSPALAIRDDATLEALILLLAESGYSGLPVTDAREKLAGVVSTKDVLATLGFPPAAHAMRLVADSLKQPLDLKAKIGGQTVKDIMTTPPLYVQPEATMADVADIFSRKRINRLPVADDSGVLRGIITRADLIKALSRLL